MRVGARSIWFFKALHSSLQNRLHRITDMLNPLNCNWRESYYSASILCSLISLSIFIKNKIVLFRKITWWKLGNKKRFFFLFLKAAAVTEHSFSFGPLYCISCESWIFTECIFKNKFCLRNLIKSRAKLKTNDWTLVYGTFKYSL